MITKFIEATNGPRNWGKFMLGRFAADWDYQSVVARHPLLRGIGWGPEHLMVFDLQTGEGAIFRPGGSAKADLEKHKIWVCPLFEPFLEWLYKQDLRELDKLPDHIDLPDAEFSMSGYRRAGLGPMATKARERPANFNALSAEEQWQIDKQLGILDWDGSAGT